MHVVGVRVSGQGIGTFFGAATISLVSSIYSRTREKEEGSGGAMVSCANLELLLEKERLEVRDYHRLII